MLYALKYRTLLFILVIEVISVNIKTTNATNKENLNCTDGLVQIKSSNTENYKEGQCINEKELLASLKTDQEVKLTNNKTCRAANMSMPAACTLYRSNTKSSIDICFNTVDFTPLLARKQAIHPTIITIQHSDDQTTQKTYHFAEKESKITWPLDDFPIKDNASYTIQQDEKTIVIFTFFTESSTVCEEEIIFEKTDILTIVN